MAALIRIEDNREGYHTIIDYVLARGRKQASRNGDTLEVTDMSIELADPTKSIPCGINRRGYSTALAALEGLQLVAGQTYDDLMVKVAPNTEQFREDDTGEFHGGYGRRIESQIRTVIDKLNKDRDTRQAVVTIWDPKLDAAGGKKDHPCTTQFNWRVREGRLLMTTTMRSQDAHWGWPYDVVMFSTLHLTIAKFLGVEVGPYVHNVASFHIYTKDIPAMNSLMPWNGEDTRLAPIDVSGCKTWHDAQRTARRIVTTAQANKNIPVAMRGTSNEWYHSVLRNRLLK